MLSYRFELYQKAATVGVNETIAEMATQDAAL
jgi:hypothetical protein